MTKFIFNPRNYPTNIDFALPILRIVARGFMLTLGMGKFKNSLEMIQ